ncbi:hypothetical protein MRX96_004180 [Rhipicephalus microplus]
MPCSGKLLRLHGALGGVNWRPTRFAVDGLHPYACSLCGVIPKHTLLLPCEHALCETCKRGSVQEDGGRLPAGPGAFRRGRVRQDPPCPCGNSAVSRLVVGTNPKAAPFVDTLPALLRHYEEECSFHAVECPRCGEAALHANLVAHYKAGCPGHAPSATNDEPPRYDSVLRVGDINATLGEFNALLNQLYQDQLPTMESKMNEITELVTNHGALLRELSQALRDTQQSLTCGQMEAAQQLSVTFRREAPVASRRALRSASERHAGGRARSSHALVSREEARASKTGRHAHGVARLPERPSSRDRTGRAASGGPVRDGLRPQGEGDSRTRSTRRN